MQSGFSEPTPLTKPVLPDLGGYYQTLMEAYQAGQLTDGGALNARLEQALRQSLGVENLLLCASGTSALMTALCCLPLSGEVITTPFTHPATVHAITLSSLTPVFADVDPETGVLLPEAAEKAVTPKTSAILPVHVYGTPCDVDGFDALAKARSLYLVYDAAHAFGVRLGAKSIIAYGDASALSFHAENLFHTVEGGAVSFRDEGAAAYARAFNNFGVEGDDTASIVGWNGKMNELQAAMGLRMLELAEAEWRARMRLIHVYRERLSGIEGIAPLPERSGVTPSAQYFVVRILEPFGITRDEVFSYFRQNNVFVSKCFCPLVSDSPAYARLPNADSLPNARRIAQEALSLPLYGTLAPEVVESICDMLEAMKR